MVKSLHRAGLEVVLDVVYNHTGEGNERGPTLSLRGVDTACYSLLDPADRRHHLDVTGTGNTLNMAEPRVTQLVMDSLRYWVQDMSVDGSRFDLAPTLGRSAGSVDMLGPFFQAVGQDPVLSTVKLIAEPWDIGPGGYQLGAFPAGWAEWNGKYRDCVRRFWRGDPGQVPELASRLAGSSDVFARSGRGTYASVNFITSHDGFTLADLVSYEHKHNEANSESNHDGADENFSRNWGAEGPTASAWTNRMRDRMKRNLIATLLCSQGVPMILSGDEIGQTQGGNNNAYCQDNETSWLDWDLLAKRADVHRFVTLLNARRVLRDVEHERQRVALDQLIRQADISWHGVRLHAPDWGHDSHSVAFTIRYTEEGVFFHFIFNAYWEPLEFALPSAAEGCVRPWHRWIDTFLDSPDDIIDWDWAPLAAGGSYRAQPRAVVVLITGLEPQR